MFMHIFFYFVCVRMCHVSNENIELNTRGSSVHMNCILVERPIACNVTVYDIVAINHTEPLCFFFFFCALHYCPMV